MVLPEASHHLTQRGTDGPTVLFSVGDRRVCLELLGLNARGARGGGRMLGYCRMDNHVHVVLAGLRSLETESLGDNQPASEYFLLCRGLKKISPQSRIDGGQMSAPLPLCLPLSQ